MRKGEDMKKIITLSITAMMLFAMNIPTYAWGGYTHWEIAQRTIDLDSSISDYNRKFYASGALFADLGKDDWDDSYTVSDSEDFSDEIVSIAQNGSWTGSGTEYLASGWKAHYIQDNKGAVSNIEGGPSSYRAKSGWVDEYLRDDQGIDCPINGSASYGINYTLISQTYDSLDGFSPTDSEIDEEIEDMYFLYNLQILLNTSGWTSSEKQEIEDELDRVAELCDTVYTASLSSSMILAAESEDRILTTSSIESLEKEIKKNKVKENVKVKMDEIKSKKLVDIIKSEGNASDEYILDFKINDMKKYVSVLQEAANLILESDFTLEEIYD
jgi:DNA polymerase III delta prime subunit